MIADATVGKEPGARFTVEVDALSPSQWDEMAGAFDDLSYDQSACYAERRWGAQRSSHLVVRQDGVPVAGARTLVLQWPGIRRGIAYVKFGPFWRRRGATPDIDVYRRCIGALVDEYCVRRGHCLTVLPRASPIHHREECDTLRQLGFLVRRPMLDPNRYLVDLSLDAHERMGSVGQKWRYNLRQALRNGIECRLEEMEAGLATFAAMHERMVARKRYADLDPLHLLPSLASRLGEAMRPRIVLAFHGDTAVAGAVVACCGDTAFYLFGASDEAGLALKAGYALQWWIVEWLSGLAVRWYDLGGEALEPGLRQFKKGLVGKRGVVMASDEFDRWTSLRGRLAADGIYRLRDLQRALRFRRARPAPSESDGAAR